MASKRRRFDAAFKARVALEAIKEVSTIAELSSHYEVHPNQIRQWKKRVLEGVSDIFSEKRKKQDQSAEELQAQLYQQIGQLKVELDWVKKKSGLLG